MELFEPICWAPRCATPADGHGALRRLLDDGPEFLFRRHAVSSHEHISLSNEIPLYSIIHSGAARFRSGKWSDEIMLLCYRPITNHWSPITFSPEGWQSG